MGKQKGKENKRKLTKAEQLRKMEFEKLKARLEGQGYKAQDLTIGLVYANVMALVLGIPIVVILGIAFFYNNEGFTVLSNSIRPLIFILIYFLSIIIHELIHGIFWAMFAKEHLKSISFGFIVQYMTPYCTCKEPLGKGGYIIGALMPTVILGIMPSLVAILNGSTILFVLGAIMILGGGGDLTVILKLLCSRINSNEVMYIDHPYQAGVVVFVR